MNASDRWKQSRVSQKSVAKCIRSQIISQESRKAGKQFAVRILRHCQRLDTVSSFCMKPPCVVELRRLRSPAITPQALAWDGRDLWMGSRDVRRAYKIDIGTWKVRGAIEAPGIPWP